MLTIGYADKKGRGVFAGKRFVKGEVIERAPVIVVPDNRGQTSGRTVLDNYYFEWGSDLAVALGYGSLYNHSYDPNSAFILRYEEMCIEFVALRDIEPKEEITIHYIESSGFLSSLWFDVHP